MGATALTQMARIVALTAAVLWLQVGSGAYQAELSTPDESPHFVTALMIRDYIASGFPERPWEFGVNYYLHYPKVAFGSWPPLFHVVQAIWLLILPVSKASVLWLLAITVIAFSALLGMAAARLWGFIAGLTLALLLIWTATSQFLMTRVLADGLVALLDVSAALCWVRYLNRQVAQDALVFGLVAGLSMLTKQNGAVLMLLPFVTIPLTGQWHLFRRRVLWGSLLGAAAIGGPFIIYSARIFVGTDPTGTAFAHALDYCRLLFTDFGLAVWPFTLLGVARLAGRRVAAPLDGFWATFVSLPIALVVFHSFTPNLPATRYLYPAYPSILLLAAYGLEGLVALVRRDETTARSLVTAGVVAMAIGSYLGMPAVSPKPHLGFDRVAQILADRTDCATCVILSSSRSEREGLFIVEMALRDDRPQHFVLRANKVLSKSDWIGRGYELLYQDSNAIQQVLMQIPVKFVVIDDAETGHLPHHDLLMETMRMHPTTWKQIFAADSTVATGLAVYENVTSADFKGRIDVDMTNSLGQSIGTTVQ